MIECPSNLALTKSKFLPQTSGVASSMIYIITQKKKKKTDRQNKS